MTMTKTALRIARTATALAFIGIASLGATSSVSAQEATAEHLAAARSAIAAIRATDEFDLILPKAADALRREMIQKDPNLGDAISAAVDEEVLKLASRRADLEAEAARAYANIFSQDELTAIATFYTSDVGKKLISEGSLATRKVIEAANIWQNGIGRDLAEAVAKRVKAASDAAAPAETPADGAAPAEAAPAEAPKQ